MKKIKLLGIFIVLIILTPFSVYATSGACSSHGGVNCSIGPQYDGSVMCNDGWNNSSVQYRDTVECYQASSCPVYLNQQDYSDQHSSYNQIINEANQKIQAADNAARALCYTEVAQNYMSSQSSYQSCINYKNGLHLIFIQQGGQGVDRSLEVTCSEAPSLSNQCNNVKSDIDAQYLILIAQAQKELSCIKLLPTPIQPTKTELEEIANQIKSQHTTQSSIPTTPSIDTRIKPKINTLPQFISTNPEIIPVVKVNFWTKIKNFFKHIF